MHTLTIADFAIRLAVGLGCGALIGLERQWRARMAGLRTNALVAAGATLFVLYAAVTEDNSPTRVASYVVSGIGFLGGGVILREGFNVRGLNTAATLWCSAAVGVLAASGHLVFTVIATGTVIAIHVVGRPLGRLIDHDNNVEADEGLQAYQVQVICRPRSANYARAQIVQHTSNNDITLWGMHTGRADGGQVTVTAHLLLDGHTPAKLERLVAELSSQPGIYAVHWYAGEPAQTDSFTGGPADPARPRPVDPSDFGSAEGRSGGC
ncbi:MgtC/SapB family protein [Mycobacterium shinjukuense]|uniref:Methyltransferase n=1 Tax=Mycobacterium shinjukuense TaxID=398694 RepID=A0A7I7MQ86_9MYCO|nr:MgtC/SapB family protein [Mycobacterium shinjukuense]MCV6984637.1 MgtC/SapB family protein [Mycobacterium shinjukuense]BBX73479.1 methyltransferase [Mycobacterium shinjukuense]